MKAYITEKTSLRNSTEYADSEGHFNYPLEIVSCDCHFISEDQNMVIDDISNKKNNYLLFILGKKLCQISAISPAYC